MDANTRKRLDIAISAVEITCIPANINWFFNPDREEHSLVCISTVLTELGLSDFVDTLHALGVLFTYNIDTAQQHKYELTLSKPYNFYIMGDK